MPQWYTPIHTHTVAKSVDHLRSDVLRAIIHRSGFSSTDVSSLCSYTSHATHNEHNQSATAKLEDSNSDLSMFNWPLKN